MALGLSEDGLVARARRVVATHIVPEKAGPASLARPVYRIRWPQSVLIEPIGPFLRIIVNTHALVGRGEKIQMMTECEPCAAHEGAGLIKQIGKPDRKSVVSGKSGSVRGDFGGRRIIKKNKKNETQ